MSDDYTTDEVYDDVKNAIDRITPYPAGAEKPIVRVNKVRTRTISVALYGNADLWALKERRRGFPRRPSNDGRTFAGDGKRHSAA